MNKKEMAEYFLSAHTDLFRCPVCGEAFEGIQSSSFVCQNGHSFDLSRKGTLHFLLKQSKNDYGKEMLSDRYAVAQKGLFHPLLERVFDNIEEKEGNTLDVGCGEGSHLAYLKKLGLEGHNVGFDISKEGIQLAAAHYPGIFWCVADLSRSPFASKKYDTLLNLFSPSNYQEFERILKPGGQVIKVVPEENYLIELRRKFYETQKDKQSYSNQEVIRLFEKHFQNMSAERVTYQKTISPDWIRALIRMTPLSWGAEEKQITQLLEEGLEEVTVDVLVLIGQNVKEL